MTVHKRLEELFIEHGFPFYETERSIITTCPQCNKEKHLYLYKTSGNGKCMKCGTSFSAAAVVVAITGCTYHDAFKILDANKFIEANQTLHFTLGEARRADVYDEEIRTAPLPANFLDLTHNESKPGLEYLVQRGVWWPILSLYNVRYCPSMKRVIFPVRQGDGYVGWQGRDITGKSELRYMSPKGFQKARVLLGYELVNHGEERDYVILSEGPVDCLRLAILGNSVCSMGKEVSTTQIKLIQRLLVKKVYLALDPDAFPVFDAIALELEPEQEVYIMMPPEGRKDFGECEDKEILEAFKNARRYTRGGQISANILK